MRTLGAVEVATMYVETVGADFVPFGCGGYALGPARLCHIDAAGRLRRFSGAEVARLFHLDGSTGVPWNGTELLRQYDADPRTGVRVWVSAAVDPSGHRQPTRLRDLFASASRKQTAPISPRLDADAPDI